MNNARTSSARNSLRRPAKSWKLRGASSWNATGSHHTVEYTVRPKLNARLSSYRASISSLVRSRSATHGSMYVQQQTPCDGRRFAFAFYVLMRFLRPFCTSVAHADHIRVYMCCNGSLRAASRTMQTVSQVAARQATFGENQVYLTNNNWLRTGGRQF